MFKKLIEFEYSVVSELKKLLEEKHLYQNTELKIPDLGDEFLKVSGERYRMAQNKIRSTISDENWIPNESSSYKENIHFKPPDVKIFCNVCKRKEAFNFINNDDFNIPSNKYELKFKSGFNLIQNFIFSYMCQSCKSAPELFIVRRNGLKLTLCGRSPMEQIEIPECLPKICHSYYNGSLLAFNSGHVLPGIFMLRTLIEQFIYITIENDKKENIQADEAIEHYIKNLDKDFKERFPSLKEIYGDLSEDMHKAIGSDQTYVECKEKIILHFEGRKLFEKAKLIK